jgi:hypothetical protein
VIADFSTINHGTASLAKCLSLGMKSIASGEKDVVLVKLKLGIICTVLVVTVLVVTVVLQIVM